ncbi:MAG: hypothetical protein ACT4NY_21330, partial [Pseudonocardiales bacterium]
PASPSTPPTHPLTAVCDVKTPNLGVFPPHTAIILHRHPNPGKRPTTKTQMTADRTDTSKQLPDVTTNNTKSS